MQELEESLKVVSSAGLDVHLCYRTVPGRSSFFQLRLELKLRPRVGGTGLKPETVAQSCRFTLLQARKFWRRAAPRPTTVVLCTSSPGRIPREKTLRVSPSWTQHGVSTYTKKHRCTPFLTTSFAANFTEDTKLSKRKHCTNWHNLEQIPMIEDFKSYSLTY